MNLWLDSNMRDKADNEIRFANGLGEVEFELGNFSQGATFMQQQLCLITPAVMGPAYFREAADVIDVFRRHGMTVSDSPAK